MKATWTQAKKIWGFCELYGNKNTDWAALAREDKLTADKAGVLLGYILDKKHSSAELCIKEFIPDFKLSKTKDTPPPERNKQEEGQQLEGGTKTKSGDPFDDIPPPPEKKEREGTGIPGLDDIIKQKEALEQEEKKLREEAEEREKRAKELQEDAAKEVAAKRKKEEEEQKREKELAKERDRKPPEIKTTTKGYYKPKIFDAVYACVKAGLQVFLSGPAGCGKSRLATEIAEVMKCSFFTMSMTGGMRYAQVFGGTQITDGKTEWIPGELLQQIQQPGLVLIDEILSADPEVVLGLNGPLEKSVRAIQTPIGKIQVHDKCVFIAAANTVGRQVSRQYTGAQRHDDSLLDRFITFRMGYDQEVERFLVSNSGVSSEVSNYMRGKLTALRMKIKEHNIPFDASTRRLLTSLTAYKAGLSMKDAFEKAFIESLSPSETRKVQED